MWPAYAVDGNGHDDGDGKYTAQILVAGIGVHFYLGGEGRGALRPAALWRQPEGCLSLGLRSRALEPRLHTRTGTPTPMGLRTCPAGLRTTVETGMLSARRM